MLSNEAEDAQGTPQGWVRIRLPSQVAEGAWFAAPQIVIRAPAAGAHSDAHAGVGWNSTRVPTYLFENGQ